MAASYVKPGTLDCKTGISSVVGANRDVAAHAAKKLVTNMERIFFKICRKEFKQLISSRAQTAQFTNSAREITTTQISAIIARSKAGKIIFGGWAARFNIKTGTLNAQAMIHKPML